MGVMMRRRMVYYSRPSGGVGLLRNLALAYSYVVVDVLLSFVVLFCVKYL